MQKRIPVTELASIGIETVNKEKLVDVSGLTFDTTVPQEQRAARIWAITKNPYCFRVGDIGVKLEFLDNAPVLQDVFDSLLKRKKGGL
ncbi:hypothetical protein DFR58_109126 [Anaerobacterium chartisolvens]|uniref:DUF6870 domain-containing protein n=1 Tax=Anaerobacterium chartisolvens TaxID=1297424 RepID=A0A369B5U8_9FIRM|nr:hypothetical protein [Anaerobacterium chartisolvens]RCX16899.1 hypothetical protein DFR58_109126 [Anaerobacterium chartisolvens]